MSSTTEYLYRHRPTIVQLRHALKHAEQRLDALDAGDPVSQVRSVLSWSYDALTPPAARLFRLLSLCPATDISGPAAASLAAHPVTRASQLLTELTRANMLAEPTRGRYTYHDLLHAFATEQVLQHDSDWDRQEALTRLLDHYLHSGYTADRLLHPARDPIQLPLTPALPGVTVSHPADSAQAMSWLNDEHRIMVTAVHLAADTGNDRRAWQLAWTIKTFLYWRGQWHDLVTVWASALQAAHRIDDPIAHCEAHRLFAYANTRIERYADAEKHFQQAVELYHQIGDAAGQARTENTLALLKEQQGNPRQALHHAQQALALYTATGHSHGQATALNTVGWYHAQLGDHAQALAHCEQALILLQQIDYPVGEASAWDSLGYAHRHLGRYQEAIECYHRARVLRHELGQSYKEAITCISIGDIMHTTGERQIAIDHWKQALTILKDLGHPDIEEAHARLTSG